MHISGDDTRRSRRTADGNARAIEQYKRAIAHRRELRAGLVQSGVHLRRERHQQRCPAARSRRRWRARPPLHAVRANPNLSEAQFALGYYHWLLDWDWTAAESAFRLAIDLDPSNAPAYRSLGHALSQSGRHSEAETPCAARASSIRWSR